MLIVHFVLLEVHVVSDFKLSKIRWLINLMLDLFLAGLLQSLRFVIMSD